jgi:hypothetical protein
VRTLLTSLLLLTFTLAFADGFRDDERLAKPISMRLKIAPLSSFVKELGKEAGVGIFVAQNIADRKITAIFKDKPAKEAMAMVEKTFFCEWKKDSAGYRLVMSRESQRQESDQLQAEQEFLRNRVATIITQMTALAERPKEEQAEIRDRMKSEMDSLRPLQDAASKKRYAELRADSEKFRWLYCWDIGFALRNASAASDTLAAGRALFASTKRGEALPLPSSSIPAFRTQILVPSPDGGEPRPEVRSASGAFAALRCNMITGDLDWKVLATGLGPSAAGGTGTSIPVLNTGEADIALAKTTLRTRLRTWSGFDDTVALKSKIVRSKATAPTPGYYAKAFSIADHLEFLADCAGIPIIADAFRLPASTEVFMSSDNVGDYVRDLLSQTMPGVQSGHFRTESGWLLFKHPQYWRRLAAEVPESLFDPMERKGSWSLSDYVGFASGMTPLQAEVFKTTPSLTRFPRIPLMKGIPAFRVWGNLSGDQQRQAYGPGLPFSSLNSSQKTLYVEAVMGMFWQFGLSELFFPLILKGSDPGDQMGLLMRDGGNGVGPVFELDPEEIGVESQPQRFKSGELMLLAPRSVSFHFGPDMMSGTAYNILLPLPRKG